jgi:hypothetical protein
MLSQKKKESQEQTEGAELVRKIRRRVSTALAGRL